MQSAFIFCFVLHGYRFGKATIIYDILNNSKYYRKGAYVALLEKTNFFIFKLPKLDMLSTDVYGLPLFWSIFTIIKKKTKKKHVTMLL